MTGFLLLTSRREVQLPYNMGSLAKVRVTLARLSWIDKAIFHLELKLQVVFGISCFYSLTKV